MKRRAFLRVVGATVTALVVAAAVVGVTGPGRSEQTTLVGYFPDASPLDPGSQIRAAGVHVGNVDNIELQDGKARVTFNVDPSVLPVHQDARMIIRPVNLLGESYVELDPGTPSKPYQVSAVIPAKQTSSRVTLQDVLNTFDDPTATALAVMVTTLGEGMQDSGRQAAAAFKALAPAMRGTQRLAGVLDRQNGVLTQLVDRVTPVARALATDDGDVLARTVTSTDRMLSTVAANRNALDDTMAELPATLATARRTLANLAGTADATTPTLAAMRPITDDLDHVTGELHRFADSADPALASLKPVLERADTLLDQAAPAVAALRKAGPNLRGVAKNVRPLGDVVLDQHLSDLMRFVKQWALSTNGRDGLSHYFRGVMWVTPDTLQDLLGTSPQLGAGKEEPDRMMPSPLTSPALPTLPAPLSGSTADPTTATGLSQQQERSLLGQLLGGP